MKRNPLKSLTKVELLELMAEQEKEIQNLQQQLEQKDQLLKQRTLCMTESGNIAQAAIALNGVFEAAQKAADQYVESVKAKVDNQFRGDGMSNSFDRFLQTSAEQIAPQNATEQPQYRLSDILLENLTSAEQEDNA